MPPLSSQLVTSHYSSSPCLRSHDNHMIVTWYNLHAYAYSLPAMTLSMAYSKSRSVTEAPLYLAACKAASFTMLAISALAHARVCVCVCERERERERERENIILRNHEIFFWRSWWQPREILHYQKFPVMIIFNQWLQVTQWAKTFPWQKNFWIYDTSSPLCPGVRAASRDE